MKKLIILLSLIFILPFCFAEIKQVDNTIKIDVSDNILRVNSTGVNYERDLGVNVSGFNKELSYSYYVNLTCDTQVEMAELNNQMDNLTGCVDDLTNKLNYYELYAQCNLNFTSCNFYKTQNEDFKVSWSVCNSNLNGLTQERSQLILKRDLLNLTATNLEVKLADSDSRNWLFIIISIAELGIIIWGWRKYARPVNKSSEHPKVDTTQGMNPQ